MTSATTWESLRELPARRHVAGFLDQRLLVRGTAAQGVEADATPLQIHLRPYQAMLPQRVHRKGAPQQPHLPTLVAPSQKDQTPLRMGLQVQPPATGKGTPRRSGAWGGAVAGAHLCG